MRRSLREAVVLAASFFIAPVATAQTPIPVRSLSPAVGTDSGVLLDAANIRPLADGRVIVNDRKRQRLILFDQTLQRFTTIADTAVGARTPWPAGAVILSYPGDSTAWLDFSARAFVMIDPNGVITRTFALPNTGDIISLAGPGVIYGGQAFDANGRLVIQVLRRRPPAPSPPPQCKEFYAYWAHDSVAVIRRDPASRTTDTLGLVAGVATKLWRPCPGEESFGPSFFSAPYVFMPTVDEWTMSPDGTVAIVRGHDYHIDWIAPDGRDTSSPKMPFDWLRITLEQKQHFADSINAVAAARAAAAPPAPALPTPDGMLRPSYKRPRMLVEADGFPDYYPPIRVGTVKSDPDGNVWLLPTTSVLADGGLVYDVVNRNGEIVERVKFPPGRKLIAVGHDGVVYMAYTPKGLVRLERATVNR